MTALYIGIAGALGSVCRHYAGILVTRLLGDRIPFGTLAVNVLGSFLIGAIMVIFASRDAVDSRLRWAITVGFLGGFTTYSSFAFETVSLIERKRADLALVYVLTTVGVAALSCFAGIAFARFLVR